MSEFNLAELVAKHRDSDNRPIVRHIYCLSRDLLDRRNLLEVKLEEVERVAQQRRDRDQKVKARYGALPPGQELRDELEALGERIEAVSVVVVCKALSAGQWGEFSKDRREQPLYERERDLVVEAFSHFERAGKRLAEGRELLEQMLEQWNYGELHSLAVKIQEAIGDVVDVPFSVRQSLIPHS